MIKIDFQVRISNFQDSTRSYIEKRINNLARLLIGYESLIVRIESVSNAKSRYVEYKVSVALKMPHAFIKVSESGRNINHSFDKLLEPLDKKLARYHSQDDRWGKHKEWKLKNETALGSGTIKEIETLSGFNAYEPELKRKFYDDDTPLHPAEAIEKMELMGHDSFLFRNIEINSYAMIYRRRKGGYGIVQPLL